MNIIYEAILAKRKNELNLFTKPNVVGVSVGEKISQGEKTGKIAVVVFVSRKISALSLSEEDLIPKEVNNTLTDIVETGPIYALGCFTDYCRPAIPGYSLGHPTVTAGTFGCVVEKGGEKYILSNNHVLANCNRGQIGDNILQPGPYDGGKEAIARLADFKKIQFKNANCPLTKIIVTILNSLAKNRSHHLNAEKESLNEIDAALAKPLDDSLITTEIKEIGSPRGNAEAQLGMAVQKTGRTTGYQQGIVSQIDATISVKFAFGQTGIFHKQFGIYTKGFSAPGDSGSAILDSEKNVVGLLFAGGKDYTFANEINNVLDYFKANIAT